jgi:hypothetical protein
MCGIIIGIDLRDLDLRGEACIRFIWLKIDVCGRSSSHSTETSGYEILG